MKAVFLIGHFMRYTLIGKLRLQELGNREKMVFEVWPRLLGTDFARAQVQKLALCWGYTGFWLVRVSNVRNVRFNRRNSFVRFYSDRTHLIKRVVRGKDFVEHRNYSKSSLEVLR